VNSTTHVHQNTHTHTHTHILVTLWKLRVQSNMNPHCIINVDGIFFTPYKKRLQYLVFLTVK